MSDNDLLSRLENLKKQESELKQLKLRQEKELQQAQKKFLDRNKLLKQYIHSFFRQATLKEHYNPLEENIPGVTLVQYSGGECLVILAEAEKLTAQNFSLHSGYILDAEHREEVFDFTETETLELPVSQIDQKQMKPVHAYLKRVVTRHIQFLEDTLKKGYVRRRLHSTLKNPWRI